MTEFGRAIIAKSAFAASAVEYVKSLPPSLHADKSSEAYSHQMDKSHDALSRSSLRRLQLTIHSGADLLLRTAYLPNLWPHRVSLLLQSREKDGNRSSAFRVLTECTSHGCDADYRAKLRSITVVGPLCFSGDVVRRNTVFVCDREPLPGDVVVIHDVGGYTLSMYSHYNSRLSPPVFLFSRKLEGEFHSMRLIRSASSLEDALAFWRNTPQQQ